MKASFDRGLRSWLMVAISFGLVSAGPALSQTPVAPASAPAKAEAAGSSLVKPSVNAYNGSSESTLNLPNINPASKKPTAPPDPWKIVSVVENNPTYTVDVKYPQFDPIKGSDPSKLNEEIKRYVYAQIDAARAVMPAKMQHIEGPKPLSYIKGICKVSEYTHDLCSLEVDLTNYAFQSAHPVESLSTFNFRLDTNQQFGLKDVFRPEFKYIPVVSKMCITALSKGLDEEGADWVRRGAAPEDKNFIKFQVTREALQIVFDPYSVDNGADGFRTVPIVWDRLRANVSTDTPFKKLVAR
ncbi:MAG: DUF3298 domain-containing protein [Cyanobacteria bacterium SZAS LIN-2]|nr:DUF3298 domain-containing protein [Cyanobacteria bacterium SZAS LIN-3]MBS1997580.1 DUF3298 domain-containing protein [Cyanobacteria bacterium SZAS LIN-2]MBS2008317.1 DUF3298 domain-containing protein [Cyanobacteria bacterium SZAS TMP-1]